MSRIYLSYILVGAALPLACNDSHAEPSTDATQAAAPSLSFLTEAGQVPIAVEVADTPAARARGLMYRDTLDKNAGMVFVFPADADHSFWMKNTHIPLDMIFVSKELLVVGVVQNAEPLTETSRKAGAPSRYVVEVNGGFAAAHGVVTGARVKLTSVPETAQR